MGKTEEKLNLQAMERERKKREAKDKKKISYRYDHIKDLDKEVREIKMKKGGSVARGMGAATQGGKFKGVF